MSIKKLAKSINNLADAIRYHADNAPSATGRVPRYEGPEIEHPIASIIAQDYAELEKRCAPQELTEDCVGFATNAPSKFNEAVEGAAKFKNSAMAGMRTPIRASPHILTEDEDNFVDPYDAPHNCSGPKFAAGLMPAPPRGAATPPKLQDYPPLPAEALEAMASANDTPQPPRGRMADGTEIAGEPDPTAKAVHDAIHAPEPVHPSSPEAPALEVEPTPTHAPGWQTLTVEELDAAPPSVEVDTDGLPWDERIHSSGKSTLVDGTWRLKRGVPDEEYQEVVAELKKLMAIPAPSKPADNVPPPPPSADVAVPPAPSAIVDNLPGFVKAVTGAQLDKDVVLAAVKNAGLENVMQLGARPDLIAGIAKELGL